jgi:hypothetical protein
MEKLTLEQIDHEIKSLELKEKLLTFDRNIEMRYEEKLANQRLSVLQELRYLLTATKIDESKSIVGGESVYKNLLNEYEEEIVKMKMLKIIQSL